MFSKKTEHGLTLKWTNWLQKDLSLKRVHYFGLYRTWQKLVSRVKRVLHMLWMANTWS